MSEKQRCGGTGRIDTYCTDPQCGDSTWDHYCGEGTKPCPGCPDCNPEVGFKEIAEAIFDPQPPPTPPDIPQGDIQEALEELRRYLRGCRAMLAVEKCCSADLITPDDAETHLQAVQRWVEGVQATIPLDSKIIAEQKAEIARQEGVILEYRERVRVLNQAGDKAAKWADAEIATLREENDCLRTENVSLSNQREMAVAETVEHKATIARLRDERNTYRGALEYCERHILDTCNESQTLIVIRKALKEGDPGEVPAPSEPSEKPCGTCGGTEITPWNDKYSCPDCTPGKEGGEG